LSIIGYANAVGSTIIKLEPPEPLVLQATTSIQHTRSKKSPLHNNVLIFTRWEHNGTFSNSPEMTESTQSGMRTLQINNTQPSNAGVYRYVITHFTYTPQMANTAPPLAKRSSDSVDGDSLARMCSGIIMDAMGQHAMFAPAEFHVYIGKHILLFD